MKASRLLEEIIRDEIIDDALDTILLDLAGLEVYEIDFDPVEAQEGMMNELVRVMRDERSNTLSR